MPFFQVFRCAPMHPGVMRQFVREFETESAADAFAAAEEACESLGVWYEVEESQTSTVDDVDEIENLSAQLDAARIYIKELEDALAFVERWANHHGAKSFISANEALSVIQHYPPIVAITKSYTDGKVPETFDPYARIRELEALLAREICDSMGRSS